MAKRIFLVSSGRLVAFTWDRSRFQEPYVFEADEEGLSSFSVYLDRLADEPVYVLVDVVEEEFREDTIPHVFGGDRRALLRTKSNRLFRDSTYTHAIFQGREADGRRDDKVLFTALIRPEVLTPWIAQIERHKMPLAGVYSLPVVSELLVKPLGIEAGHALVVTLQSGGGLRQTFFLERRLKLSRLAVMPHVEPRGHASYVLGEVERVRRYLNSLRMLPHEAPLDVYILGDQRLLDDVRGQSPDSVTSRHHLLELDDVARRIGMKGAFESAYGDRIFAHLLVSRRPENHYAPSSQTRYFSMYRARAGLKVASAALVLGSLAWSGVKLAEGVEAARELASLKHQTEFYDERYRIAREQLPATPAESRELKTAVEMVARLRDFKASPMQAMIALSAGLDAYPQVRLERIQWVSTTDATTAAAPVVGERRSRREAPGPDRVKALYQRAHVWARIEPFDGDYRTALELVSQFAESLRTLSRVELVEVVSLPLDIGEQNSLSGDAVADASNATAPFELRVLVKDKVNEPG